MLQEEKLLILDFGGQYKQLIARRVRELHVFSEVKSCETPIEDIKNENYKGIILTGGPASVNEEGSPTANSEILSLGIPVLGICYGAQWMAKTLGGSVKSANREYGKTEITRKGESKLFGNSKETFTAWMSHTDRVESLPEGFKVTAFSKDCPVAAMENAEKDLYAVQFHPEVEHTEIGRDLLNHFVKEICGCAGTWKMDDFAKNQIEKIKEEVGDKHVICGLSGGVDSSVAAVLVHKAIGKQLTCIFVDHGLLRKGEADSVEEIFTKQFDMKLVRVDAADRFLNLLKGVTDPEEKRKIIGETFIRVFEDEAKKVEDASYLVQGTIYPDVIESGVGGAVIKSHHNVGGLPEDISFKGIIEPLRDLFKDEVREVGTVLGIPDDLVWRQPFPGPGLAVRCLGEVREDKLAILREADAIFREEIKNAGLDRAINQYFAVLTNMRSVGVQGDARTYDYTLALRGVTTTDFMTADWARIPLEVLEKCSTRICNEVQHINRVVYDITAKPPSTIEWE